MVLDVRHSLVSLHRQVATDVCVVGRIFFFLRRRLGESVCKTDFIIHYNWLIVNQVWQWFLRSVRAHFHHFRWQIGLRLWFIEVVVSPRSSVHYHFMFGGLALRDVLIVNLRSQADHLALVLLGYLRPVNFTNVLSVVCNLTMRLFLRLYHLNFLPFNTQQLARLPQLVHHIILACSCRSKRR